MAVRSRGRLGEHITITRRYVRSVDLVRDLTDRRALEGYVVTPSVHDALHRILLGIARDSTQRAFRITGPYGSGKSAFGLLLARLVIERATRRGAAFDLVRGAGLMEAAVAVPAYAPLVLNGQHVRFADALLDAIHEAASDRAGVASPAIARDAVALRSRSNDSARVLDLLARYAERAAATRKGGVLLLIDEMGRYLEYAALNRATEDVAIFQHLAECAGGATKAPIAVVGLLHHRFADYAAGFGAWVEAEWTRSAERYEDVPLVESTDETAFLLAKALTHTPASVRTVATHARRLYGDAARRGVFGAHATLTTVAPQLYPLHPSTVACLAHHARRFGQNGRSIFSFLQSYEPFGFQRFVESASLDVTQWYRLPDLFDYIAAQHTPHVASRDRRWTLVVDALRTTADLKAMDASVLKCVGLFAALEPMAGLKADADTLAWCVGAPLREVEQALARLVRRNLLYRRAHRGDYSPWASTSVDLDKWTEEAMIRVPPVQRLDAVLASLPAARPLIAHRHYHATGTLRAFAVHVWNRPLPLEIPIGPRGECDGTIVVVPAYPDERVDDVHAEVSAASQAADARTVFCIRRITPADLACAHALAVWRWIQSQCGELRGDDLARREVRGRVSAAEDALAARLRPFCTPSAGDGMDAVWLHDGQAHAFTRSADVSEFLSTICDAAYAAAPTLKNELINRSTLSSAAASARMRLLELMAEDSTREHLGLVGAPPERTMYLSMFRASGMHQEIAPGTWRFAPPEPDPLRWRPVWDAIGSHLITHGTCSFEELLAHLSAPPFGLRAGPALLVIGAFMLHQADTVAFMERGSFQPSVTGAHFMRLAKTPAHFALRYVGQASSTRVLLQALVTGLVIWRDGMRPIAAVKPVTEALFTWWNALPDYTRDAARVSAAADAVRVALKRAREPIQLLYDDLPAACGLDVVPTDSAKAYNPRGFVKRLNAALQELLDARPQLQRSAATAVLDAFGVPAIGVLRDEIQRDHAPYREHLTDVRLRAFVDRTASDLPDDKWLDSIASLIVGRRLDAWSATSLDHFTFEMRSLARQLTRWVVIAHATVGVPVALSAPIASIYVTDLNGQEETVLVRSGRSHAMNDRLRQIRALLADRPDARDILGQLLIEYAAAEKDRERLANE
jgi:hypothetical protein